MKNLIVIICSILFSNVLYSQFVDGLALDDLQEPYVSIDLLARGVSNYTLLLDFGQESRVIRAKNQELRDRSGNPIRFNSPVGALNLLYKYGYEVLETYDDSGNCSYLLKRRKDFTAS